MKIFNKFIWSKKEPSNKNDVWFDGSTWKMYTEEAWQSFTLPVDAADKVAKVIENVSEVYQEKLNAGYGIVIEGNTISVDDSAVWEAIETLQQNKVEQTQLNDYVPWGRYESTSQMLIETMGELSSTKADKAKTEQELNKKLNKTDVATINGQSLTEGGDIVIEGPSYDDTEIQNKITELSAEKEDKANKTTTLSSASTDTQYPSAKAVFTAIDKKSEVSLEALANGNLKVTINGVSKDFMPATPSGDPQHDAYVSAGAAYNATANDINILGLYGDTITHKSGCWLLNEVGDLTNEEMRNIYSQRLSANSVEGLKAYWRTCNTRTTCSLCNIAQGSHDTYALFYSCTNLLTAQAGRTHKKLLNTLTITGSGLVNFFYGSQKLEKALFIIDASSATSSLRFCDKCYALQYIRVKGLKMGISFADSAQLSNDSILYMINNEVATAAIVITLHASAYDRAIADSTITEALTAHPNVSLAKA